MMKRYELHTKSGIITGTLEELKKESRTADGLWWLYCLIESSMNKIKLSNYRSLSVQEYKDIHRLCRQGWGRESIRLKFNISSQSVMRIKNDEFHIIKPHIYR